MKTLPLPRLPVLCLAGLLACSSPTAEEPRTAAAELPAKPAAPKSFVGTLRFLERHSLDGLRSTDYVTMYFRGPQLRREVRPNGFADSTYRYGILVDVRTDSVTYYLQHSTRNTHCRIASADYLRRVADQQPILPSLNWQPYRTIFSLFPADGELPHQQVNVGAVAETLKDCRAIVFLFPDRMRCETMYSEQIKVEPKLLPYIEHHAPAALPTLALMVHYTQPDAPGGTGEKGLVDRIKQRIHEPREQLDFDGLDWATPTDQDFRPPAGSRYAGSDSDLNEQIRSSSSSSHHSLFD
ncbi:hypothetical protein [Hymenobacter chitinivorans]|uniref:Outer membrane lipoprotein-sorting protein n=1 Tax=Hymenobacter chitinivorans DSM 11115 TaxID=1121954 RepID=A0A2M9BL62_9BACT|nr:hypothetical protein [Hymenobacter chitinivorans]PJJ58683.1 hypothetical protein CLV45_0093 [Hymenobacter chitinivorans DSM 11115]